MAGLLGPKFNDWMTPDRAISMQAIGTALSGLGSGQPVNLGPAYAAMQERKDNAAWQKRVQGGEFANLFTPEENAAIAKIPAGLAQQIITERMKMQFAPKPRKDPVFHDGQWWDISGGTPMVVAGETPSDDPASVREYQFAQSQGFEGTFQDFITAKAQAGRTSVTVGNDGKIGTVPSGYMIVGDGENARMVPIPGGPADLKVAQDKGKEEELDAQKIEKAGVISEDIQRALRIMKENPNTTTGIIGQLAELVPGSTRKDLVALIDTVKGNLGFAELQRMRDNSPTGGAVGQLSDRELIILSSMSGNLDPDQSASQLAENLRRIQDTYEEMLKAHGMKSKADPMQNGPQQSAIPQGYKILGVEQ